MTDQTWQERLEDISDLEDGWLDGEGKAVTSGAYIEAQDFLDRLERNATRIYPMPDGGIQIVIGYYPYEIEIIVSPLGNITAIGPDDE
jgi:hypothetical protein